MKKIILAVARRCIDYDASVLHLASSDGCLPEKGDVRQGLPEADSCQLPNAVAGFTNEIAET